MSVATMHPRSRMRVHNSWQRKVRTQTHCCSRTMMEHLRLITIRGEEHRIIWHRDHQQDSTLRRPSLVWELEQSIRQIKLLMFRTCFHGGKGYIIRS